MEVTRFIVNMIRGKLLPRLRRNGEAALIDCGAFYDEEKKAIRQFLESHNLRLVRMFNTHAHFDHLFGAHYIYKEYGVKMEIAAAERETYESAVQQMQQFMHRALPLELPPVCNYFADGDELKVGNFTLQVIATPGHTPGGVCLYATKRPNCSSVATACSVTRSAVATCPEAAKYSSSMLCALAS